MRERQQRRAQARRLDVLRFIDSYAQANRIPPSHREIANRLRISVSTVHFDVRALGEQGLLTFQPASNRTIVLTLAGKTLARGTQAL